MKTPEKNRYQKVLLLFLLVNSINEYTLAQTTCNEPIRTRTNITLCQGDTYQFGDRIITSSGIYIENYKTTTNNCDSIATLGVDYLNSTNFSFTETITTNEFYFFKEQNLTTAGIYRDTFADSRGCDSILTLTLQVIAEQENCANGIDDDGDGLIDAFDNDCLCLLSGIQRNLIPNGDFEEKIGCCRAISMEEELCVDNWINLSNRSFIYLHPQCWSVPGQDLPKEGITLESGFFAGDFHSGGVGDNLSGMSLGICLEEPMYPGNTYILSFDLGRSFVVNNFRPLPENMHFTINGITDCSTLMDYQFDQDFCEKGLPFERLANIDLIDLSPKWNHFEMEIRPSTTIEAIFLSGNCEDNLAPFKSTHIFYDNFSIIAENGFRIRNEINVIGDACQGDFQLSIPNTDNLTIDWYKDSLPLPEINSRPYIITPEITATKEGIYHAKVTFEDGRCQLVGPLVIETLDLNLPADTTICPDRNLFLNVAQTGVQYEWQDGSTQPIFSVTKEGLYWVEAQKGNCRVRDSIEVNYAKQRSFLPNDTTICDANDFLIAPQQPFDHVLWWENPLELDTLLVNTAGIYHAFIIDQGCDWLDSIQVNFAISPIVNLGNDTTLCIGENLTLTVPATLTNYAWQDGSQNPDFLVTADGIYSLISTESNCSSQDSISITFENCAPLKNCESYLPNSFSPNGDGINDVLQLLTDCELQFFEMEVYDRWGSLVFETTDVRQAWDGTANGELLETGVYLWTVRYQFLEQEFLVERVETVTVVR